MGDPIVMEARSRTNAPTSFSPQQDEAMQAVAKWMKEPRERGKKKIFRLFGYAGTGKEQPITCVVQTPHGPRFIGDLEPGDYVFGKNGKSTKVIGVFRQGIKPVYRITFRDNSSTRCGINHLWHIKTQKWEKVLPLHELIERGITNVAGDSKYQIPLCDPVEYDSPHPSCDPYTIGVLIGDGYLAGNCIVFSAPPEKLEIVDAVRAALPDGFVLTEHTAPSCPQYIIKDETDCHHNRLAHHLAHLGLRTGSPDRFIPSEYLYAPVADRVELLRGLMDTDGSIKLNRTSFSTKSKRLAADITALVQSLGGIAISKLYERKDGRGFEFQINIKTFFNPFKIGTKANLWSLSWKNPPSRYIKSIVDEGVEEQVCIKVDADDELYLTDNFIVTHNTTLARHLAENIEGKVCFGAFTGKAALVLRTKGCDGATTIHSMIYSKDEDNKHGIPDFKLNPDAGVKDAKLVIIDECSMVDEELGSDLLSFNVPVLVLGDPAQLPPVKGAGYFTSSAPDFLLTEIHRQAAENPIIRMAAAVRQGHRLREGTYGTSCVLSRKDIDSAMVLQHDQVLVGMNKSRNLYNERIRTLKGFEGRYPDIDDRLVCLRNNHAKGLLNGGLWKVEEIKSRKGGMFKMIVKSEDFGGGELGVEVKVMNQFFEGTAEAMPWSMKKHSDQFDYGYALTVHKAQGSQWNDVMLFDESGAFPDSRDRWLYTAITRAAERVTIVV